ncbi:MAG: prenyltransferase [Myxococcales bacterium]|nr:prenyltransferase [Myxococcales bacterium]
MAWWRREGRERRGSLDAAGVAAVVQAVRAAKDVDAAWAAAAPLRAAIEHTDAAIALAACVGWFGPHRGVEAGRELLARHGDVLAVLGMIGESFPRLTDVDDLNAPPPADPWFAEVVDRLERAAASATGDDAIALLDALAAAARRLGRAGDARAERAHAALRARQPDNAHHHYNAGLFFKTRGRWAEGQAANQRAIDLGDTDQPAWWNLGICATGAGDGATALTAWRQLGQQVELGQFGLPEGGYPAAKVRVAQQPLAERDATSDEPGVEENLWLERLSPCHGVVRVAVFADELGVEYGDVVMFDGAPVGRQGGVPIFPHLATLHRRSYQIWRFVGAQATKGQLIALSKHLPEDTVIYPHTEQIVVLCDACAKGRGGDGHAHTPEQAHHVVRGKLCAPPHLAPATVLAALDAAIAGAPGAQIAVPDLCAAAGDAARAEVEARRLALLVDNT